MKIRVLGAGFYGCHLATALLADGHDVEVHEIRNRIFDGASGNIPARLHLGAPHYPRSAATQSACIAHNAEFMKSYGHLTQVVPVNLYAVADTDSVLDFGAYRRILEGQVEFLTVHDPREFGLRNVEGAVQIGERHIVVDRARIHFERELDRRIRLNTRPEDTSEADYDLTVDATFCANDSAGVDRYEPCLVLLLAGPTDRAVTIVDGPFPSLYPWNEGRKLSSLSSAQFTPFSKSCRTYGEAKELLDGMSRFDIQRRGHEMILSMAHFYPAVLREYEIAEHRVSIRAMPRSGSDARLVDVVRVSDRTLRVRAGKMDAIFQAERMIMGILA